jgi:hypothetical protein
MLKPPARLNPVELKGRLGQRLRAFARLAIFILPIDLRSFILKGVFNEFLINPMTPIVAPPDFSKDKPAGDRSSRDEDRPQMPCLSPGRRRAQVRQVMIIAVRNHTRPLSKEQHRHHPTVTLSNGSPFSHCFVGVLCRATQGALRRRTRLF